MARQQEFRAGKPTPEECHKAKRRSKPPPLPAAAPPRLQCHRFTFSGSAGEFFRIWVVNLFPSVVTLGQGARGQRGRCRVNPPLGQARRVIRLPEEGRLETDDRQAVERLEAWLGLNRGLTRVHRLEGQFFGPSELPAARQRGFEATFARIARDVGGGIATGSSSAAPPSSAPTPSPCPQASSSSPTTWCTWPKTTASS